MLNIDWSLSVAFVSVIIFLVLMHRIFFKPLSGLMERRDRGIEDDLTEAARLRQEAETALTSYQTELAGARREMADQLAATQRAMEAKQRESAEHARAEAAAMVAETQATLAKETEEARGRLLMEARELAQLVAAKLVGK